MALHREPVAEHKSGGPPVSDLRTVQRAINRTRQFLSGRIMAPLRIRSKNRMIDAETCTGRPHVASIAWRPRRPTGAAGINHAVHIGDNHSLLVVAASSASGNGSTPRPDPSGTVMYPASSRSGSMMSCS